MADDALGTGAAWVSGTLQGSVTTSMAMIAVAALGLSMLSGRIPARRAVEVVFGCFILFSASIIADGITGRVASHRSEAKVATPPPAASYIPRVPRATPYDPYAGASVPFTQAPPSSGLIR